MINDGVIGVDRIKLKIYRWSILNYQIGSCVHEIPHHPILLLDLTEEWV